VCIFAIGPISCRDHRSRLQQPITDPGDKRCDTACNFVHLDKNLDLHLCLNEKPPRTHRLNSTSSKRSWCHCGNRLSTSIRTRKRSWSCRPCPSTPSAPARVMQAYEETFSVFVYCCCVSPRARLIYVTSQRILPSIIDYYLALLPGVYPESRAGNGFSSSRLSTARWRALKRQTPRPPTAHRPYPFVDHGSQSRAPCSLQHNQSRKGTGCAAGYSHVRRRSEIISAGHKERLPKKFSRKKMFLILWALRTSAAKRN